MKIIYNAEYLVSVTIEGREENLVLKYRPYSEKFGGLIKNKQGFYYFTNEYAGTKEDILSADDDFIFEDNKLYYKPKVTLRFIDGSEQIKRFDTFSQASKYGYEIASKNINSKLEIKD